MREIDGADKVTPRMTAAGAAESAQQQPTYFTLRDYLAPDELVAFLDWEHDAQVAKVAEYLDYVGQQPAASHFTSSARASTSWAELRTDGITLDEDEIDINVLRVLLDGKARSGFGAFGSDPDILPQKVLSLLVAHSVKNIGHVYVVQKPKRGPLVLNSRSFHTTWCHAEKQKMMHIKQQLDRLIGSSPRRPRYWSHLTIVVDRPVCADCAQYFHCFAASESAHIYVKDPARLWVFPSTKGKPVQDHAIAR